jgi:hypothetical protein
MESKFNRVINSFENINVAIEDILKNKNNPNGLLKSLPNNSYKKVVEDLYEIRTIIYDLAFSFNEYKTEELDEIRCISLSVRKLLDEGEYEELFSKMMEINNQLGRESKNKDLTKVRKLKSLINGLPKSFRNCLVTAQKLDNKKVRYNSSKVDNLQFIIDKYVTVKYNFKKIPFDSIERDEVTETQRADLIVYALNKVIKLCKDEDYDSIKDLANQLIKKYQVFTESRKKFKEVKPEEKEMIIPETQSIMEPEVEEGKSRGK